MVRNNRCDSRLGQINVVEATVLTSVIAVVGLLGYWIFVYATGSDWSGSVVKLILGLSLLSLPFVWVFVTETAVRGEIVGTDGRRMSRG